MDNKDEKKEEKIDAVKEKIENIELEKKTENIDVEKESKAEPKIEVEPVKAESQAEDAELKARMESDDLPDEIREKLEKRKQERAKSNFKSKRRKKKEIKKITSGRALIKATYNNTIVTLTDLDGNVISWASAGIAGFKGPKKSTPYAAQIITKIAVMKAKEFGLSEVSVFVRGVGTGREAAVRALNANGLIINAIKDITPMPHNGCRARKPRRV
jgi:small subunit ribosomal protein S11